MSKRPYTIKLSDIDRGYLQKIFQARIDQTRTADHSRILLQKEKGRTDKNISEGLGISTNTVRLCISKYFEGGVKAALPDAPRSGHPVEITDAAKAWIVNAACMRPRIWATLRNCGRSKPPSIYTGTCRAGRGPASGNLLQRQG